jgi:hypothetical protein
MAQVNVSVFIKVYNLEVAYLNDHEALASSQYCSDFRDNFFTGDFLQKKFL